MLVGKHRRASHAACLQQLLKAAASGAGARCSACSKTQDCSTHSPWRLRPAWMLETLHTVLLQFLGDVCVHQFSGGEGTFAQGRVSWLGASE